MGIVVCIKRTYTLIICMINYFQQLDMYLETIRIKIQILLNNVYFYVK